ncbi:MAG: AbgT family transporter [Phycisphaerae bacterium]|nr:AbgT family transporter [Phycisphaerae bacterium]
MSVPPPGSRSWTTRWLDWVERVGNRLPDPVTLFAVGSLAVLAASAIAAGLDWQEPHPTKTGTMIEARSLLTSEGLQWVFTNLVKNFTDFHPLGVVLVAMLGIGIAERTGLIAVLLRGLVAITPRSLVTPSLVFVGVMSSLAADAGYVVLPPLAAAIFARLHRAPLAGLASVFIGVAGGFSANLLITSLDPLLQGLTQESARLLDADAYVRVDCNWWFMAASTFLVTLVGWAVTAWIVEPRFTPEDVAAQIAAGREALGDGAPTDEVGQGERRGLAFAGVAFLLAAVGLGLLILVPGGPLHGAYEKTPGKPPVPVWADVIVPILFLVFLIPGVAYGLGARTIRSDRDVARMLGQTMASMGTYIVLAFFAGQFVAWFRESNLGTLLAVAGVDWLRATGLGPLPLLMGLILFTAFLNLFLGSASAKWALLAPVFVPLMMGLGIAPELTQAAYRVGDSTTNAIAPLNAYLVVIIVYLRQYQPQGGLGTLVSLMLPYTMALLVAWTAFLLVWAWMGWPLGPGEPRLFLAPLGATGG